MDVKKIEFESLEKYLKIYKLNYIKKDSNEFSYP